MINIIRKFRLFKTETTIMLYKYGINDKNPKIMQWKISRYGSDKLALLNAYLTMIYDTRINDYFIIEGNSVCFYVYSKLYGICKMFVDLDKLNLFTNDVKISLFKDKYTYYASTKYGTVHRYIFKDRKLTTKDKVDHINKNGLDNRKSNLRIVSNQLNAINCRRRIDNTSGVRGVFCEYDKEGKLKKYRIGFKTLDGVIIRKSFSVAKYGKEQAFKKAVAIRKYCEKRYGYQYTEEGSETKSEVNISIDDVFIPDNVRKLMASGVGNINSENGITFYY